jgi:nucleotide-binding universal stress UspA family protein
MSELQNILFPTDFSEHAGYAFQLACALARDQGAQLLLLHVIPPPMTHAEVVARAGPDSYRDQLWRELDRMKPPETTLKSEILREEGHPAEEIVRTAKENKCGLIVMGTHGRTGLWRMLMGSVAEHVLRHSTCPVLTVRAPLPMMQTEESAPAGEPGKR